MVSIIENHAEIVGTLLAIAAAPDRPGFVVLSVRVEESHPIGDWPNLFDRDVGTSIDILAREGSDAAAAKLGPVRLRVKKGGPTTVFAE